MADVGTHDVEGVLHWPWVCCLTYPDATSVVVARLVCWLLGISDSGITIARSSASEDLILVGPPGNDGCTDVVLAAMVGSDYDVCL